MALSIQELMQLADQGGAFAFPHDEPDLYKRMFEKSDCLSQTSRSP